MAPEEKAASESLDDIGLKYAYAFGKGKLYTGGDKTSLAHGFTKHYQTLLQHLRLEPVQLLELGVFHGKSLAMWSEYFAQGTVHGVDINLKHFYANESELRKRGLDTSRLRVYQTDLTKPEECKALVDRLPQLDVIIDDALHTPKAQVDNLLLLFDKLHKGGFYIIEDVVDPAGLWALLGELVACVSNCDTSFARKNKWYSIAVKVESVQIKANWVAVHRKAK